MKYKIVKAGDKDAARILDLQKLCFKSEADIYHLPQVPPMWENIHDFRNEFKTHTFLKVLLRKRIIGSLRTRQRKNSV
jgi:hypothetical protein